MNLDKKLADESWLKLTQGRHLEGVRNKKNTRTQTRRMKQGPS